MTVVESTLHVVRPTRSDALLDGLQMITGAGLILFMWSHMTGRDEGGWLPSIPFAYGFSNPQNYNA